MKVTEMKIVEMGNHQLYIPLSKKLEHELTKGDKVRVEVVGKKIVVTKL
jgi:hypothetical protein